MQSNLKTTIIKYSISTGISLGLVFFILWLHQYWDQTELVEKYKILSDAFTVPGLLFILVGLLVALTNEGSLTALGWMLKRMFKLLNPFSDKNIERYSDYMESRQKVTGFSFLFYTGLAFAAVSIVFLVLYYSV